MVGISISRSVDRFFSACLFTVLERHHCRFAIPKCLPEALQKAGATGGLSFAVLASMPAINSASIAVVAKMAGFRAASQVLLVIWLGGIALSYMADFLNAEIRSDRTLAQPYTGTAYERQVSCQASKMQQPSFRNRWLIYSWRWEVKLLRWLQILMHGTICSCKGRPFSWRFARLVCVAQQTCDVCRPRNDRTRAAILGHSDPNTRLLASCALAHALNAMKCFDSLNWDLSYGFIWIWTLKDTSRLKLQVEAVFVLHLHMLILYTRKLVNYLSTLPSSFSSLFSQTASVYVEDAV